MASFKGMIQRNTLGEPILVAGSIDDISEYVRTETINSLIIEVLQTLFLFSI